MLKHVHQPGGIFEFLTSFIFLISFHVADFAHLHQTLIQPIFELSSYNCYSSTILWCDNNDTYGYLITILFYYFKYFSVTFALKYFFS